MAARDLLQQAISLNPSLALARAHLGGSFNLSGEPRQAMVHLQAALRLNSNDLHNFYTLAELALTYTLLERWGEAIDHAGHAIARRPAYWYAHMIKINALVRTGDLAAAKDALNELRRVKPSFSRRYIEWLPFVDRSWIKYFVDGLKMVPGSSADWLEADSQEIQPP